MDVYRVSDAEPESTATSSPSTSGEAALREPPLSPFGEITSPGFRALRMAGTTLATASETRIDVFGKLFGNFARCRLTQFVDVPTLQLVHRIEIPPRQIAMIMVCGLCAVLPRANFGSQYIELDDEHVFLCGLGYGESRLPVSYRLLNGLQPHRFPHGRQESTYHTRNHCSTSTAATHRQPPMHTLPFP